MRWLIVASLLLLVSAGVSSVKEEKKVDDEFAEFEEEFEFVSSPEENTPSRKEGMCAGSGSRDVRSIHFVSKTNPGRASLVVLKHKMRKV